MYGNSLMYIDSFLLLFSWNEVSNAELLNKWEYIDRLDFYWKSLVCELAKSKFFVFFFLTIQNGTDYTKLFYFILN